MSNSSAVLYAAGDLRIEERPTPVPATHEVLVEIHAVGICGSDVHYFEAGRIGRYVVEAPMVVGHESAGVIVGVGTDVSPERIGQTVALEPGVPCRHCEQCRLGRYNLCPFVQFFATPPVDGSIARYVVIDAEFAHVVPHGLSAEKAAMAEPVSVGVWACRKAEVTAGDRVLVTGAGPIGLLAAQVARGFGATQVTVTDVSEFRLDTARDLGFTATRAGEALEGEFDVLLECSGAAPALASGLEALASAGRAVLVGMGADEATINVPLVQGKELTLQGIFRYANTYPTALQLIASGGVDVDRVITHRFGIAETQAALTLARREARSLKAVVDPRA
ncbi:sorbitol dehydrogenase [Frigoribacterium sp. Leaf164]|nr:sorbitol dehydrogenase [Frigoribacterium sp. Leaf164]MBD8728129.1 NAD(P)-dependent alcohol dehydrogenase [Frigoribacterium sp. CFBP 13707]